MNLNGAPIIGQHRDRENDELTAEQRDRLAAMAAEHGERPAAIAFLVIVPEGGDPAATPDLTAADRYELGVPTVGQIASACRAVYDDVNASKAAHMAVTLQQQLAAAAMQQAENQRLLREMQQNGRG